MSLSLFVLLYMTSKRCVLLLFELNTATSPILVTLFLYPSRALFPIALVKTDNADKRGDYRDSLIEDTTDNHEDDVIGEHHRRGDENAVSQNV